MKSAARLVDNDERNLGLAAEETSQEGPIQGDRHTRGRALGGRSSRCKGPTRCSGAASRPVLGVE